MKCSVEIVEIQEFKILSKKLSQDIGELWIFYDPAPYFKSYFLKFIFGFTKKGQMPP